MSIPLLPMSSQIAWTGALFVVLILHLRHVLGMHGQARWWHGSHVAMAAGMIVMYFPPSMMSGWFKVVKQPCLAVFSVVAIALIVTTLVFWVRERSPNLLWVLATSDMMAMAYMWLPRTFRPAALTWVIIGYFGLETVAWMVGVWGRLPIYRTAVVAEPQPKVVLAVTASVGTATGIEPTTAHVREHMYQLKPHMTLASRITLAIMTASMAYMFLVML